MLINEWGGESRSIFLIKLVRIVLEKQLMGISNWELIGFEDNKNLISVIYHLKRKI